MIKTLNGQIAELEREIATAIREHPDGEIFTSLFKGAVITAAELLAEMGDCRGRYPTRDTLAGDGARPRSRSNRASAKPPASAGAATNGYAGRFTPWLTAAATTIPGRKTSTPKPSRVATITPARYVPSDAPGHASCGSAGKTACRMTPPATARCSDTSLSPSPPPRAPCPT